MEASKFPEEKKDYLSPRDQAGMQAIHINSVAKEMGTIRHRKRLLQFLPQSGVLKTLRPTKLRNLQLDTSATNRLYSTLNK